jgi:hypothetical protein
MAEARREYQAIFSIGGKLLGSFRGAISAAQARLARLSASAKRITGLFSKLSLGIGALGTAFAAFAATKVLTQVFSGAIDQAIEAEERTRAIGYALLNNDRIRKEVEKHGFDFALKQTKLIQDQNEALGKQGVLRDDIFNEMSKQLALSGMPTQAVMDTTKALGDLLVARKGANATEADAAELAMATLKAMKTGKAMGLREFGIFADPKTFKALSEQARLRFIMAEAAKKEGANIREATTPLGRLRVMRNRLEDMSQSIGEKMLPLQVKMAEAWLKALPHIQPLMEQGIEWLITKLEQLAEWVKNTAVPWFQKDATQKQLKKVGDAFQWVVRNAKWLVPTIIGLVVAFKGLQIVLAAVNIAMLAFTPAGAIVLGVIALAAAVYLLWKNWDKVKQVVGDTWAKMKEWPVLGPLFKLVEADFLLMVNIMKQAWDLLVEAFNNVNWQQIALDFKAAWGEIEQKWVEFKAGLQVIGDFMQPYLDDFGKRWQVCIEQIKELWAKLIKFITSIPVPDWVKNLAGKGWEGLKDWNAAATQRFQAATGQAGGGYKSAASLAMAPPVGWNAGANETTLAAQRQAIMQEFQTNPDLQRAVFQRTVQEVGAGTDVASRAAQQAFMEELFNRSVSRKQSLTYAVHDPNYYPEPVFNKNVGAQTAAGLKTVMDQVVAGSNVAKYATGNASGTVGFGGGPQTFAAGGERFGIEGADLPWARRMRQQARVMQKQTLAANAAGIPPLLARPMQFGGIVRGLTHAVLGERGPEAVLPLSRGAGMLGRLMGGGASQNVHFNPIVTIHGNATEAEQKSLDTRLRQLSNDFIRQFSQAQTQERRLSYEGGYA